MIDSGGESRPELPEVAVPFRPRSAYAEYQAFGSGPGAALVEPGVTRDLRNAAELATQERRITGGLLYGRIYADDLGEYVVVDGYLEAGPGEIRGDRLSADGADEFTLSQSDLRLQRDDAARMYAGLLEVGWWRSRPELGEFGPRDLETQAELVPPGGVGLLVYGTGVHWGRAHLGPAARPAPAAGDEPGAGDTRARVARPASPGYPGKNVPRDVRLVIGALSLVIIVIAIIVGVLVSSVIVGLIVAVIGLLAIALSIWMARR
jgi:hypothetical protein